jgi:hypothetical protein
VWGSDAVQNQKIKFGPENTLMLDSDEVSVYNWHKNSLITDRFDRDDVWPSEPSRVRNQIEILTAIKDDIFHLMDTCGADVREHIAQT